MTDAPEIELRISLDPETLLGPGKAALLQAIDETDSIAAAGRRMGMSYKRAWYLIDTTNAYFREPVVVSAKGREFAGRRATDAHRARDVGNLPADGEEDARCNCPRIDETCRSRRQERPLTRLAAGIWFPI